MAALGRELRGGRLRRGAHPRAQRPFVSWYATEAARSPAVGTFHTYSTNAFAGDFAANVVGARRLYSKL